MANQKKCIIWGTDLQSEIKEIKNLGGPTKYEYENPRAGGKYLLSFDNHLMNKGKITFLDKTKRVQELNDKEKVQLSGYIAKQNLLGKTPYLDSIMKDENWLEKLPPIPNYNERIELLLKGLVSLCNLGESISLKSNIDQNISDSNTAFLYALSYCFKSEEFQLLINSLEKEEYIQRGSVYIGGGFEIKVTGEGWTRAESILIDSNKNEEINSNKTSNEKSKKAFIAMWIDSSMENPKQSIEEAVRNAGYEPLRIDDKKHINKIDDEILSEIEKARFIVCDLTSAATDKPRSSVYFEAGYAKGKKIPVIWTCKEQMKEVHFNSFDTRQYKCLFWDENNMDDFIKELQAHIEGDRYIGKGPLKGV